MTSKVIESVKTDSIASIDIWSCFLTKIVYLWWEEIDRRPVRICWVLRWCHQSLSRCPEEDLGTSRRRWGRWPVTQYNTGFHWQSKLVHIQLGSLGLGMSCWEPSVIGRTRWGTPTPRSMRKMTRCWRWRTGRMSWWSFLLSPAIVWPRWRRSGRVEEQCCTWQHCTAPCCQHQQYTHRQTTHTGVTTVGHTSGVNIRPGHTVQYTYFMLHLNQH